MVNAMIGPHSAAIYVELDNKRTQINTSGGVIRCRKQKWDEAKRRTFGSWN